MPNGMMKLGPDVTGQGDVGSPTGPGMLGGQRQLPSMTNILMAAADMADRKERQERGSVTGIRRPNRGAVRRGKGVMR